jgi:hypothetical protein
MSSLKSYGMCHLPDEKLQNGCDNQCCRKLDEDWVFITVCLISLQTSFRYYNSFTSCNLFWARSTILHVTMCWSLDITQNSLRRTHVLKNWLTFSFEVHEGLSRAWNKGLSVYWPIRSFLRKPHTNGMITLRTTQSSSSILQHWLSQPFCNVSSGKWHTIRFKQDIWGKHTHGDARVEYTAMQWLWHTTLLYPKR